MPSSEDTCLRVNAVRLPLRGAYHMKKKTAGVFLKACVFVAFLALSGIPLHRSHAYVTSLGANVCTSADRMMAGDPLWVTWGAEDPGSASSCTLFANGAPAASSFNGEQTFYPGSTTMYTYTCYGNSASPDQSTSVTVTVVPYMSDAQAQCYLNRYTDLADAFGPTNLASAKSHWVSDGYGEGRDESCPYKPPTPTGLSASCSGGTLTASWNSVARATSYPYRLSLANDRSNPIVLVDTSTSTSFSRSGLTAGASYDFWVQALQYGSWSDVAAVYSIACPGNGSCGSANGVSSYNAPSSGLCSVGGASVVSGPGASGPYTWTCYGIAGGSNASCSASWKRDGVCGSSSGGNTYTAPSSNLCSVGSASGVSLSGGAFNWTCGGVNGGATASCSSWQKVDAFCGPANSVPSYNAPSSGQCSPGTPTIVSGPGVAGPWTWTCLGLHGGLNSSGCSAPWKRDGTCGSSAGLSTYAAPTTNFCTVPIDGSHSAVSLNADQFSWTCAGQNGGLTTTCTSWLKVNAVCGTAVGVPSFLTPPAAGGTLCNPPLITSKNPAPPVTKTASFTWTWTCMGLHGGTNSSLCTAPRISNGICSTPPSYPDSTFGTRATPPTPSCVDGTASGLISTGSTYGVPDWTWICYGQNGGSDTPCQSFCTNSCSTSSTLHCSVETSWRVTNSCGKIVDCVVGTANTPTGARANCNLNWIEIAPWF